MARLHGTPDGNIPFTVVEEAEADTKEQSAKDNLTEFGYIDKRRAEYPDWGTQLNKIYDDGITKWKAEMVDPIKAKYPKP
jgi:hypothetical protein